MSKYFWTLREDSHSDQRLTRLIFINECCNQRSDFKDSETDSHWSAFSETTCFCVNWDFAVIHESCWRGWVLRDALLQDIHSKKWLLTTSKAFFNCRRWFTLWDWLNHALSVFWLCSLEELFAKKWKELNVIYDDQRLGKFDATWQGASEEWQQTLSSSSTRK